MLHPQAMGFLQEFDLDCDKKLSFSEFKKAVETIKKNGAQEDLEAQGGLEEQEDMECLEVLEGLQEVEFQKAVDILKIIKKAVENIKRKEVKVEVDVQEGMDVQKAVESNNGKEMKEEVEEQE